MLNPEILPLKKWGDAGFDESKVRRDDDGKFAPKGGGGAPVSGAPRKHYGVVRDSKGNLFSIHDESAIGEGITIDKDGYIRSGDRTYVLDARTGSPVEIKAPAAPTVQTRSNGDREKRSRLAGAGHYGLRGAAAGAAIGAAGGAAYGSRYGRAGLLAGALGGAMSGAKTGAIGGGIYGAVAPGYKRAVKKASAFDDFGVKALRKWGASGFDESKVRRDDDGKFAPKGGGGKRRATLGDRFGGSIRGDAIGLFSGMGAGAAAGFAAERLKRAGSGRRGAKLGAVVGGSLGSTAGLVYGAMNPSRRTGRERDVSKAAAFGDFGGRDPAQVGRRRLR